MTFNVFVTNSDGGPVAGARVAALTHALGPSTRYTEGDGGCNLYYQGPGFPTPIPVDVIVDAKGYKPWCTATTPVMLGTDDVTLHVTLSFDPVSVLPAPPTRDQLCGVKCSFQGLSLGALPWFEPALAWPKFAGDHEDIFDMKADAGDTHFILAVSSQYDEPNQAYSGVEGRDFTHDLVALRALIHETIMAGAHRGLPNGFMIVLAMAGDGMVPDPVGLTYGHRWLMENFERVWLALKGDGLAPDLTPWIVPTPGFDGVVPGWQPWGLVNQYVRMARAVVGPDAPLALWLSSGYCVWSGEANDWATVDGQMFDVILQEFPYPTAPPITPIPANYLGPEGWLPTVTPDQRAPWDQVWQIVGRMIQPYRRPPEQPPNDDPGGAPFLLASGTLRGPYFYVALEFDTYGWVRWCPLAQVRAHRAYLEALGCEFVG